MERNAVDDFTRVDFSVGQPGLFAGFVKKAGGDNGDVVPATDQMPGKAVMPGPGKMTGGISVMIDDPQAHAGPSLVDSGGVVSDFRDSAHVLRALIPS